jgi:two-component system NtrC family sensor kinase
MYDPVQTQETILVVDDTPASSVLVENALAAQGWRIIAARSGATALDMARLHSPDLILLDILMPEMDGFETCRRLKQAPATRDIPVIFMTGMTDSQSQLAGFEAGAVDYVTKPIQLPQVIARVRNHLALRRYRGRLEHLVEERTTELEKANEELRIINRRLEEAQVQLVQSEKMASIGVLAAGVAHEINNPIGYVNANLGCMEDYIAGLFRLIAAYGETDPVVATNAPAMYAAIRGIREKIDLNFLVGDVGQLLQESKEGLARVKKIVQDLKDFSRVGETDWLVVDLRRGLESTLNIVRNELKYKAEIVCDFGDIPAIACLPSELNQVFLNILVNAGQSIRDKGKIRIATGVRGEEVWVEISDTGDGIPDDVRGRIFDPFFTTKPVGQGTGLGLSLSYNIVRKHHGRIEVESEVGCGTVFRIWLPVAQPD